MREGMGMGRLKGLGGALMGKKDGGVGVYEKWKGKRRGILWCFARKWGVVVVDEER